MDLVSIFTYLGRVYARNYQVVSPTNRVISRSSRRARDWINDGYHIETRAGTPYLVPGDRTVVRPDGVRTVRNPITKRQIVRKGPVHLRLEAAGWFQAGEDGGLVQPDGYQRLVLGGGDHHHHRDLLADFECPSQFAYLVRLRDNAMEQLRWCPPELNHLLGARGNLEEEYDRNDLGYRRLAEGEDLFDGYILVCPTNARFNAQFVAGLSFDGHCVRRCLEELAPDEDWSDLAEECPGPDQMTGVVYAHRCTIRLWCYFDLRKPLYEWRPSGHDHRGPVFDLFYAGPHCVPLRDLTPPSPRDLPVVWLDSDRAEDIAASMLAQPVPTFPTLGFLKPNFRLLGYYTHTHQHKPRFRGHEHVPNAWNDRGAMKHIFIESNGGVPNYPAHIRPYLKEVVEPGITYRKGHDVVLQTHKLDQVRAFASYTECPYYSGFMDPHGPIDLLPYDPRVLGTHNDDGTWTLAEYEGFVYIKADSRRTYPRSCFETRHQWVSFARLRCAIDHNDPFVGEIMIVGRRRADPLTNQPIDPFETANRLMGTDDKMLFNRLVGALYAHENIDVVLARTLDERERLQDRGYSHVQTIEVHELKMWVCANLRHPEPCEPIFPFDAAAVHEYQKITFWLDVGRHLADDWENVLQIWFDGVDTLRPLPCAAELPEDRWHPSETRQLQPVPACSSLNKIRLSIEDDDQPLPSPNDLPLYPSPDLLLPFHPAYFHRRLLILGGPGSGKTHLSRNYFRGANGRKAILTGGTNLSAVLLGPEAVTIHRLLATRRKAPNKARRLLDGSARTIIDEGLMAAKAVIREAVEAIPNVTICSDEYQLDHPFDPPTREWLEQELGFVTLVLRGNYRARDPVTRRISERCREIVASYGQLLAHFGRHAATRMVNQLIIDLLSDKLVEGDIPFPTSDQRSHYITSRNEDVDATNIEYAASFHPTKTEKWGYNEKKKPKTAKTKDPRRTKASRAGTSTLEINEAGSPKAETPEPSPASSETREPRREIKAGVAVGMQVIGIKNSKAFKNREVGRITALLSHKRVKVKSLTLPETPEVIVPLLHLHPGFAVTFHTAQGQGFDFDYYVDATLEKLFDHRMLYVAVTRATHHRYIHLVRPKP